MFLCVELLFTAILSFRKPTFQYNWAPLNSVSDSDLDAIKRNDFPILDVEAYEGKPLVYLDSAASSHKPVQVLESMEMYYLNYHSNVHRGAHSLATKATELYEASRLSVQKLINAKGRDEIIYTKGATEAINIVASSFSQRFKEGDEIILSVMEHHSNLVPWQMAAQRTGAVLKFVQLTSDMKFDLDHYYSLLSEKTKFVALSYASNVLGVVNPVKEIISAAHDVGAHVLLDSCQSVPHMPVDVQALDVDFIAASSHKMCGPTGIGFLYGKSELLNSMPPYQGGGEMIEKVELESSTYAKAPSRFEAGTPPIAEAIGLGAACEYITAIGMDKIFEHEVALGKYLYEELTKIEGVELYGPPPTAECPRTGLAAFNVKGIHSTDLSFFLDQEGVAVRTGHHCTQPLHTVLGLAGSMRASVYFYNSKADVDQLILKLKETINMFSGMSDNSIMNI